MYYLHLLRILVLTSIENLIIFVMREIGYIAYISGCFVCCISTCMYIGLICMCMCVYILYVYECVGVPVFFYMCVCACICTTYIGMCVYTRVCSRARSCAFLPLKSVWHEFHDIIFLMSLYLLFLFIYKRIMCIPVYFIFNFNFLSLLLFVSSACF